MNSFFMDYWPHIASVAVGLGALWGLWSKANAALLHQLRLELRDSFATREDFAAVIEKLDRLNTKIDGISERVWQADVRAAGRATDGDRKVQ